MTTFRGTVRGRFDNLTDDAATLLRSGAEEHAALKAEFRTEGTFTYDASLNAFSFRYTVADDDDDDDIELALENTRTNAELAAMGNLDQHGYGYRDLRTDATNIDAMRSNTRRLK